MTEKDSERARVSLDKPAATPSAPAAPTAATLERPREVTWAAAALLLSGVLALGASLALYGLHSFIIHQLRTANAKLKASDRRTDTQLLASAHQQPTAVLIQSVIFFVVLVVVVRALWRGRYWSRWAVIGVWILASFTGIFGGIFQIVYVFEDAPIALKVPVSLASLSFVVAVALVAFAKPIPAYLNQSRPVRQPGSAPARRGMFAQRDAVRSARQGLSTTSPVGSRKVRETAARTEDLFRGDANTERARAKQRMTTETMQRGAAEARARGRGSKSRRSGT
ncbi:hypothetical protein [Jatrophihabitans endophyticus]|uniref:hypothetical protein n=1 Tax=Jatrophihabitans endophyticus TaxID=1206085 RepID=UPI001A0980B9|nr:hypothetical protein [Jatrophihabitans endophyticus]MBE7189000.1 hypothetical protein [Jatrophihabitans endophyticus]